MADTQISFLESMVSRADKLHSELKQIYEKDLLAKDVSVEALNITHEIIEKCSNVMDQSMTLAFEKFIKDKIEQQPRRGGYFPVAKDEGSYRSSLGQWNAADLETICPKLDTDLRSLRNCSRGWHLRGVSGDCELAFDEITDGAEGRLAGEARGTGNGAVSGMDLSAPV